MHHLGDTRPSDSPSAFINLPMINDDNSFFIYYSSLYRKIEINIVSRI